MNRARRIAGWALLVLLASYQVVVFVEARTRQHEIVPASLRPYLWMAHWRMFTKLAKRNVAVIFEGEKDGRYRRLPMERWFPSKFGEGRYRWEHNSVMKSRSKQLAFLDAACSKAGPDYTRVRMVSESWRRVIGRSPRDRGRVKRRIMRNFRCGTRIPKPTGYVL